MHERDRRLTDSLAILLGGSAAEARARFWSTTSAVARLATDLERAAAPSELRMRLLASLDPGSPLEGLGERLASFLGIGAPRARCLLARLHDPLAEPWFTGFDVGHRLLRVASDRQRPGMQGWLVYLTPGARFPRHRHEGEEWCFNLAGRAQEDNGRVWEPGDLLHWGSDSCHGYRALERRPHVCAVVLRDSVTLLHAHKTKSR